MNKVLYLMRHAQAEIKKSNQIDIERNLNHSGRHEAEEMANCIFRQSERPTFIITSAAERTKQTGSILAAKLGITTEYIETGYELYTAGLNQYLSLIRSLSDNNASVLLIGHNPAISWLVNNMSAGKINELPTAGLVKFVIQTDSWSEFMPKVAIFERFWFPGQ